MRADFNWKEACPKEAVDDVIRLIKESRQTVKSKADEDKFFDFWKQFRTVDFMPNPHKGFFYDGQPEVDLFAFWCYWPVLERPVTKFPLPTKYEVLIPYRKQEKEGFVQYWIIPADAAVGSEVTYLYHAFAIKNYPTGNPCYVGTGSMGGNGKGLIPNPFEIFDIFKPDPVKNDERLNESLESFDDVPFHYEHGMAIIEEEPVLRLPLYNIPLQIAYEMAEKNVGNTFAFKTMKELREELKRTSVKKITFESEPINKELYFTLLLFSSWRQMNLRNDEQYAWLVKAMEKAGCPTTMKQDAWRKACDRLFDEYKLEKAKAP